MTRALQQKAFQSLGRTSWAAFIQEYNISSGKRDIIPYWSSLSIMERRCTGAHAARDLHTMKAPLMKPQAGFGAILSLYFFQNMFQRECQGCCNGNRAETCVRSSCFLSPFPLQVNIYTVVRRQTSTDSQNKHLGLASVTISGVMNKTLTRVQADYEAADDEHLKRARRLTQGHQQSGDYCEAVVDQQGSSSARRKTTRPFFSAGPAALQRNEEPDQQLPAHAGQTSHGRRHVVVQIHHHK